MKKGDYWKHTLEDCEGSLRDLLMRPRRLLEPWLAFPAAHGAIRRSTAALRIEKRPSFITKTASPGCLIARPAQTSQPLRPTQDALTLTAQISPLAARIFRNQYFDGSTA